MEFENPQTRKFHVHSERLRLLDHKFAYRSKLLTIFMIQFSQFNKTKIVLNKDVMAISVGDASIKFLNEKQNKKVNKNFTNNIKSEVTQVRAFMFGLFFFYLM